MSHRIHCVFGFQRSKNQDEVFSRSAKFKTTLAIAWVWIKQVVFRMRNDRKIKLKMISLNSFTTKIYNKHYFENLDRDIL